MARSKFQDTMYVEVYVLASQGNKKKEIAAQLGVSTIAFNRWVEKNEALAEAYNRGKERFKGQNGNGFIDYVYGLLPSKLQRTWDAIKENKGNPDEIDSILSKKNEKAKKQLFVHAWVSCNFNPSRACKAINLSPSVFKRWMDQDDFRELLGQVQEHKKNFFEECLVKSARKGEVAAIMFANRTLNRDRGYGDKTELEISGNLNHKHENLVNFDKIGLPVELQKQIMHYYRLHKEKESGVSGALEYVESKDGVFVPEEDHSHEYVSARKD